MKNQTTITDVARYAGVSQTTVSNFLNEKYEKMAQETKEKIQQAIDILDYVPSLSARRLSAKEKSKTICLIIPRNLSHVFDSMYFPTVFNVIGKAAEEAEYSILIYSRGKQGANKQMDYLLGLSQSLVDGFIIFDLLQGDLYFKEFEGNNIPYVCVGKIENYNDYQYVASDHGKGIQNALEYLISLGHSNIAAFSESKESVVHEVREAAYRKTMEKYNLPVYKDNLCDFHEANVRVTDAVYQAVCNLLQQKDRPTAFIVPATFLNPFVRAVKANKLLIPEDISVIAIEYYADYSIGATEYGAKEYTRLESKAGEVSKIAFEKLLELINKPNIVFESHLEVLDLIIGETTRKR